MKLTKVLKEYVEEQMDSARYKANKEAKEPYNKRREGTEAEIKTYLAEVVNPHIIEILKANNMDIVAKRWSSELKSAPELILQLNPSYIINQEETNALDKAEKERKNKQLKAVHNFAIECELGVDKDSFYEAVAKLVAEVK